MNEVQRKSRNLASTGLEGVLQSVTTLSTSSVAIVVWNRISIISQEMRGIKSLRRKFSVTSCAPWIECMLMNENCILLGVFCNRALVAPKVIVCKKEWNQYKKGLNQYKRFVNSLCNLLVKVRNCMMSENLVTRSNIQMALS